MIARSGMILAVGISTFLSGCTSAPRPIESIRMSGDHRYKYADYDGARDEFAEIVSRYPGDWYAQYMLGKSMLKTGEYSAARHALETAYTHQPDNQDVADALAEALYQQGDESRLFAFLRDRAATTQRVQAHLVLARYASQLNDPDSAKTAVETAIELDNGMTTDPYVQAAELAEKLGDQELAARRIKQAYGINPSDRRVLETMQRMGMNPAETSPVPPGR